MVDIPALISVVSASLQFFGWYIRCFTFTINILAYKAIQGWWRGITTEPLSFPVVNVIRRAEAAHLADPGARRKRAILVRKMQRTATRVEDRTNMWPVGDRDTDLQSLS